MARHPAVHISGADEELALATADDWSPLAAESSRDALTIFFAAAEQRDEAASALAHAFPEARVARLDVDDEDWARRSQENLQAVTVGRVTIRPAHDTSVVGRPRQPAGAPSPVDIVIRPSMGFGTGHHATTRLCLLALQQLNVTDRFALDVGTGSGVLALAARALGATRALGLDYDRDAIQSAEENLPLNPSLNGVEFRVCDITATPLPRADVLMANLTGALLVRAAPQLSSAVRDGGSLILSGLMEHERRQVVAAFPTLHLDCELQEDEWLALCFNHIESGSV